MRTKQRSAAVTRKIVLTMGALLCCNAPMQAQTAAKKPAPTKRNPPAIVQAKVPEAARLAYSFKAGETYRYRVTGFFDGHFPPFALPDSPPIHVRIVLQYDAQVKKQDAQGTRVAFHVNEAELLLLKNAAGPNGELPEAKNRAEWPINLQDIQAALDVTAVLRPDGSVASVTGGDPNSQKINFGVELRKLFLLMLPVTFPDGAVKPDVAWTFSDGLLGKNPGRTTYSSQLASVTPESQNLVFRCSEDAATQVQDYKDKNGKPAASPDDSVDTTTGTATIKGEFLFATAATPDVKTGRHTGRLREGHIVLTADLIRKRTIPDPDNPEGPLENHIDVTARLTVQALAAPRKPTAAVPVPHKITRK